MKIEARTLFTAIFCVTWEHFGNTIDHHLFFFLGFLGWCLKG